MKIIICGSGPVGLGIARQLASEGNAVSVLDDDPEAIKKINDTLDVSAFVGFPSHPSALKDVGAQDSDMIIAVTVSDEVNMTICQIAHTLFQIPIKIARIRHQNYLDPRWKDLYRQDHIPIDHVISPEKEVANAVISRLHMPGAMDMLAFGDNNIKVVEVRCGESSPVLGKSLEEIYQCGLKFSIITIIRDDCVIVPDADAIIKEADEIFFVADAEHVNLIMTMLGYEEQEARRVLIVGGGNIGLFIAEILEQEGHAVNAKIIESDKTRAEFIASQLPNVTVIHGSALDQDILNEAGIDRTEACICVTNNDEVNILSTLLAKKSGANRAFALVNDNVSYGRLLSSLEIDVTINPREMTVSSVLQHTRSGKVWAAHSICSGQVEIIEAEIVPHSAVIGQSIGDLSLPNGIRIGAMLRGGYETIIPDESTLIAEHDHVIIVCLTDLVSKVDKIFSTRLDYF